MLTATLEDELKDYQDHLDKLEDFEAHYLEKKLLQERVFNSREEYQEAFTEFKKYAALSNIFEGEQLGMVSEKVDAVWHQFILFTKNYEQFCNDYLGRFLHHFPNLDKDKRDNGSVKSFRERYTQVYGKIPEIWGLESNCTGSDPAPENCRICSTHKCGPTRDSNGDDSSNNDNDSSDDGK
jgi:hypothetical protein